MKSGTTPQPSSEPAPGAPVRIHHAGDVATITLDSPHNRNALSRTLVAGLTESLRAADSSPDVRVIVLTHAGSTFCAGADLKEAAEHGMEEGTRALFALLRHIVQLSTPVVAVVRGQVRAGGVGLVSACDLAVGTDRSTFAFTEALLGLAPAIISLTTSSRLTSRDAARKYLTGATFDGIEAARSGLLTLSAPEETVDDATSALLGELVRASPQGLRETKMLLNARVLERMDAEGDALVALSSRLFASEEAHEGMSAFRDRRPPRWAADR